MLLATRWSHHAGKRQSDEEGLVKQQRRLMIDRVGQRSGVRSLAI
jgi:hypothetical protein